jgi:hypothetical protein
MTRGTFLLGLGAQKAGTTWLHRYLLRSDAFRPGAMKEYHVWNAIYGTDEGGAPAIEGEDTRLREELRSAMISTPDRYFDHFAQRLESLAGLTADLTPAYAALPEQALARNKSGFETRDIAFRALFLMRDPVERCWSAARMYRRKGIAVAGLDTAMPEADFLLLYCRTAHAQNRSRYDATINALERVLTPDQTFVGIYEEMFEPSLLKQLSQFLGVDYRQDVSRQQFNASPKTSELQLDVATEVARAFADTLAFCRDRFPRTQALWPSYALLD